MSTRRIVVVGAGPAGLATAIALLARGHDVDLVEQRGRSRFISDAGGAYELTAKTLAHLDTLGVLAAVRARGAALSRFSLRAMSGAVLKSLDFGRAGFDVFAITRAALQSALVERLEALGGHIRYDARITTLEEGERTMTVGLFDGTNLDADLLVGADGMHSSVRRMVFDPTPATDVGIAALWGRAELGTLDVARGESLGYVGGGHSIVIASAGAIDDPRLLFTICTRTAASALDREALFAAMPRALAPMLTSVRDVAETRLCAQRPLGCYAKGRVVLIGDAAHGMPPFLGLGANSAIEDAMLVADAIEDDPRTLESIGKRRAAALDPRIAESRRMGSMMHADGTFTGGLFRVVTRLVPSALVLRQMRAMHVRSPHASGTEA